MVTAPAGWLRVQPFVRPVAAVLALAALGLGLLWASAGTTDVAPAAEPVAALTDLLALAAAVGGWMCYGWLTLAVAAAVVAELPGRVGALAEALADRLTPLAVRQALRLTLGLAVAAGPAVGAGAGVVHASAPAAGTATASPDVLPDLDRPAGQPALDRPVGEPVEEGRARPGRQDSSPVATGRVVVVQPGDTLWGIAADQLGSAAQDSDIAAEWPRWYAANRAVIGPDPDLLMPGQRLRRPG